MNIKSKLAGLFLVFILLTGLSGCTNDSVIKTDRNKKSDLVSIKYIGNSCFLFRFSDGTRIITDPYGIRYAASFAPFSSIEADVMTISHYHEDHTAGMNEVGGNPKIIYPENLNKTINIGAVEITGHPAAHILNMGDNTIFVYKIGKLKIVHMVEAESVDSPETLTAIKDADVILVYTGELGKLKGRDIYNFTKQINARIVIPQHYSINPKYLFYGEPTAELNKIVLLDIVGISVKTTALSGMDKKLKIY